MSPTLAIDFGSTRTKIAYFCPDERKPRIVELGEEIRSVMPSVFYIPPTGNVLVGDRAAQMADEDPAGIVVDIKREIHRPGKIRCGEGRAPYQRWELVAALFTEIRRRCGSEVFHNGEIERCTLTVPVCFSEPQRQKLQQAAQLAGFTGVKILDEPIAAAMHWLAGSGKKHSDHVIVVDVGGGTTDLAALKLTGHTYEAIPDLPSSGFPAGGNDIDDEVRRSMQQAAGYNGEHAGALLMKLRQVKERLRMDRDDFVIHLAGNRQTVTRQVVEAAVRTLIEKTCAATAAFLKDFEEVTGRSDTPVLLAGGGSKLPGMKEALEGVAGKERVFVWNDCEYAIALGATLAAAPAPPTAEQAAPVISPPPQPAETAPPVVNPPPLPAETATPVVNSPPDKNSSHAESRTQLLNQLEAILTSDNIDKQRERVTAAMVDSCVLEVGRGSSKAQALLGHCYAEGFHLEKDLDQAVRLFDLSATEGDALGQLMFGKCHHEGIGVPINKSDAASWFYAASGQGNPEAQRLLGRCYELGEGVEQNIQEAGHWYICAARGGDSKAGALLKSLRSRDDFMPAPPSLPDEAVQNPSSNSGDPAAQVACDNQSPPTSPNRVPFYGFDLAHALQYYDILVDRDQLYVIRLPKQRFAFVGLLCGCIVGILFSLSIVSESSPLLSLETPDLFLLLLGVGGIIGAVIGTAIGRPIDMGWRVSFRSSWVDRNGGVTSEAYKSNVFRQYRLNDPETTITFENRRISIYHKNAMISLLSRKTSLRGGMTDAEGLKVIADRQRLSESRSEKS